MSLDNEDGGTRDQGSATFGVALKKPIISYSREFLLSLSNLDACKKVPSGFDESLLSELATKSIPDRPRTQPLHGFRRNDYSSSPPARGDYNNNSRGIYGKWESRSSGRGDKDSDSQSDRDSDCGRRYGYQSRRSWQTPEHDGLLGSGSFPRPSGYAAGASAPKVRTSEHLQLSKSSEPYHPPRPYKASPYSRRDTDSYNDETFGSTECTSEDRAEEERKRRASFEMMRKEQQRALQEKHNPNLEKHKVPIEESKDKGLFVKNDESEISVHTTISSNESSFASHSHATRPLVPPGFRSSMPEKDPGLKSPIQFSPSEGEKPDRGLELKTKTFQIGTNDGLEQKFSQETSELDLQTSEETLQAPLLNKQENVNSTILHVPISKFHGEGKLPASMSYLDSHGALTDSEIVEFNGDVLEEKSVGNSERSHSTSILSKIFGSTLSIKGGGSGESRDSKLNDTWSPNSSQSSKFTQWFLEEEAKPADDILSGPPNDILSMIVGGHKVRHDVCDGETAEHSSRDFSLKTLEHGSKNPLGMPSASEPIQTEDVSPAVLTCEDLEQSILSEYSSRTKNMQPFLKSWSNPTAESEKPSVSVDDRASVHLLSLLQKGTDQSNTTLDPGDVSLSNKPLISEEYDMGTAVDQSKAEDNGKNILSSGNTLTLETLFGSAFMKELQSVGAPVSVQRGSNGSAHVDIPEPLGLPFPLLESDVTSSMINRTGLQRPSNDYGISTSNSRQQVKQSKADNWLGIDNTPIEIPLQNQHSETVSRNNGFEMVGEFQLPEEDSLLSTGNPRNHRMSTFLPAVNSSNNAEFSSNSHFDIKEKLPAFSIAVKEEQTIVSSENLPITRGSYEQWEPEIPYRNLQMQQSPQFRSPQMTQVRPLYHQLDSHPTPLTSQMKFSNPETMFNRGFPANPQLARNILRPPFHQHDIGASGFDSSAHHSMLHQMQKPTNHLHQILPEFAGSGPVSHHGNQPTGLIQEMNQMQGFPFGPRQPNISSHGAPMPGPHISSGSNPPEAFQRLIEMELRANPKQIQPPFTPGHNQGIFGHEIDMGFRYR